MSLSFIKGRRFRATAIHLLVSTGVAAAAAMLVFMVWYPPPFATIAGGAGLFGLLVGVDMVLGPALTAVAASPNKALRELRRDMAVIISLQVAAFGFGVFTTAQARPVFVSFEIDRFRVVTAADLADQALPTAMPEFRTLPWTGPRLIAAVKPVDPAEQVRSIELGLAGLDLSMVPGNWREYPPYAMSAWRAARPVDELTARYPQTSTEVLRLAIGAQVGPGDVRFLPLMSRQASWVALLASPGARIIGYLPVDGFF